MVATPHFADNQTFFRDITKPLEAEKGMAAWIWIQLKLSNLMTAHPTSRISIIWLLSRTDVSNMSLADAAAIADYSLPQIIETPPSPEAIRKWIKDQLTGTASTIGFETTRTTLQKFWLQHFITISRQNLLQCMSNTKACHGVSPTGPAQGCSCSAALHECAGCVPIKAQKLQDWVRALLVINCIINVYKTVA